MRLDERCGRRAAAGKAGAADLPERYPVAETDLQAAQNGFDQGLGRATFCRAGFAGRGTAGARVTERHTLAPVSDPRQSLGSG